MEVIDIVTFNNQMELLDLRVNILEDVVDHFYLIEASKTHQGGYKECLLDYDHPKVTVVTIEFPEDMTEDWDFENYQRAYPILGINPTDLVLTGDLDEIPDPKAVQWVKENMEQDQVYCFNQPLSQYYINNRNIDEEWYGTRGCSGEVYYNLNAQRLRFTDAIRLPDAGWHFTYIGGKEAIIKKMTENARHTFSIPEALEVLEERMANNEDVFGRGFRLETVPIDESFPEYVCNNQEKLRHLIK